MDENNTSVKLDWMYKGINGLVNREDYLLGRSVDKTLDQLNNEEKEKKLGIVPPKNHVEHECIPPSIRDYNKIVEAEQVDLSAKLQEDPLMAIKKREEEARRKFLQNPVQLKKLQEALKAQKHKKKKKHKHADSTDSDDDLDRKLVEKLQYLKSDPSAAHALKKEKKKAKKNALDTILMHKFNEFKDRLSQEDLNDILEGNVSDSSEEEKKKRQKQDNSKKLAACSDNEDSKNKSNRKRRKYHSSSSDTEGDNKKTNLQNSKKGNKKIYRMSRKSSGEDDEKLEAKSKNSDRSKAIKTRRDDSSEERYRVRTKNNEKKYSKRSDSSSSEYDNKSKGTKKISTTDRNKYRRRSESDSSSCQDKNQRNREKRSRSISRHKRYKRSRSREPRLQKDKGSRKERSNDRGKRFDRSNSEDRKCTSKSITKDTKHSFRNDDEKSTPAKDTYKDDTNSQNKTKSKQNNENDLDKMILEKLRQLRDSKQDTSSSSSEEEARVYTHYDSDNDEVVRKKKHFGLVRADGSKIKLNRATATRSIEDRCPQLKEVAKKPEKKNVKRLTEEEKEKIRKQMMKDAVKREKERSENLRQYREEDKKEEMAMSYNRDFIHRELVKSTKDTSIEGRIKSKLNSIQRSSVHMNSNFSKKI
nr:unnamed protein product [Callosobruchus analis]